MNPRPSDLVSNVGKDSDYVVWYGHVTMAKQLESVYIFRLYIYRY